MDTTIVAGVAAVLIIVLSTKLGNKWNVASPLLLVLVGLGVSFLPFLPDIEVEPEIILAVVLPPLLFSSAVNMPAMNFRREFSTIGSLAVVLVIVSAVLLGFVFHWMFPGLALPWCIALGAILSPTDAVAVSIARNVGISSRVTTILEGESLLNDATALVTLRTAVAAVAASFSVWQAVGQFAYSVAVAVVIGFVAGKLGVWARARSGDATISSIISFVVPFFASVPADLLQASGLVAAVVAGIVTGRKRDRVFSADQRLSDKTMWRAVTLVLEGGVFLVMGLEVRGLVHEHAGEEGKIGSLGAIVLVAFVALVLMTLIRAAYVIPLAANLGRRASRVQSMQPRVEAMESAIQDRDMRRAHELAGRDPERARARLKRRLTKKAKRFKNVDPAVGEQSPEAVEGRWRRLENRTRRALSDIDYYVRQPLSWRDGVVMVGAGMRGAVTLAAAQTLPLDAPYRSSLILVAFAVAVLSLVLQGGLLVPLVKWVKPAVPDPEDLARQRAVVSERLADVLVEPRDGEGKMQHQLRTIVARRDALLDLREEGFYDPDCTRGLLASMDASELGLRLRLDQIVVDQTEEGMSQAQAEADVEAYQEEVRRYALADDARPGREADDR